MQHQPNDRARTGHYWPSDVPRTVQYRAGERPMHDYLLDNARDIPDRAAYIFYGREITWAELGDAVRRLAAFLKGNGIQKGDRVGLYLQNSPQYIIAHYAVQMAGAIVSPLNPQYKAAEVEYQLNNAETRAIIAGRDLYPMVEQVRDQIPTLELAITTDYADYLPQEPTLPMPEDLLRRPPQPAGTEDLCAAVQRTEPLPEPEPVDLWEDIGLMTFTSGTTGRPKGAMLPYGSATFKMAVSQAGNRITMDGVSLAIAPFCHIAGMNNGVYMPVYARRTTVILPRFDAATTVDAIERYRCDMWYGIAPMIRAVLDFPGVQKRDLTCLKNTPATSFGIPVTPELAAEWRQLTGAQLHEAAFGLSETHTSDTFMPKDRIKWGSCGIPMPETDIRIINTETGAEQPTGETGEIVLTNPAVFKGYWKRPEATEETLRDGWVYTGDVGYFDDEGYLFFTGRIKEMIKSSGYSVFPEDVEALMLNHPAIAQSAAVGIPDPQRGESVKLFAVLKPEYKGQVSEQELINWARDNMAAYKYPRAIAFRDQLPATGAGKVLRRLLKDE